MFVCYNNCKLKNARDRLFPPDFREMTVGRIQNMHNDSTLMQNPNYFIIYYNKSTHLTWQIFQIKN